MVKGQRRRLDVDYIRLAVDQSPPRLNKARIEAALAGKMSADAWQALHQLCSEYAKAAVITLASPQVADLRRDLRNEEEAYRRLILYKFFGTRSAAGVLLREHVDQAWSRVFETEGLSPRSLKNDLERLCEQILVERDAIPELPSHHEDDAWHRFGRALLKWAETYALCTRGKRVSIRRLAKVARQIQVQLPQPIARHAKTDIAMARALERCFIIASPV